MGLKSKYFCSEILISLVCFHIYLPFLVINLIPTILSGEITPLTQIY
jgi:hypothetical protein